MSAQHPPRKSVFITGANGYIGSLLTDALVQAPGCFTQIVAMDITETHTPREGVVHLAMDIRSPKLADVIADYDIDTVVHLAAIVSPGKDMTREFLHDVEVGGTQNLLDACLAHGVRKLLTLSSGAAYGYHADHPPMLKEEDPLRGNESFPYAYHKRLAEDLLAEYRTKHPQLEQLIFRPGAILGASVSNPISNLFEKPVVLGIQGATTPFQFVWDQDVVGCLLQGIHGDQSGVYNLSGDGILTLREIAAWLQKPFVAIPPGVLDPLLSLMKDYDLTQYGPEQIDFLRYRPVLSNERLKAEFGYSLQKSTREVFALYCQHHPTSSQPGWLKQIQHWTSHKMQDTEVTKNVVITGGAGGIGRALAHQFAKTGARVALLDLDQVGLKDAVSELRKAGAVAMGIPCDVGSFSSCEEAISQVLGLWGGVDVLINNAGISHRSLLSQTQPSVIHKIMDVNFFGAVHCTQLALESLKARQGMIVAISSIAGFAPLLGRTGYSASKHALHGFFDSLRTELDDTGVGVLLVCPSFTDTAIEASALGGDGGKVQGKRQIIGSMASPNDVAQEILDAVTKRKKLLVLSPIGKLSYLVARFLPGVYARMMRSSQSAEFGI